MSRRSTRARATPLTLAEEQAGRDLVAQELLDLRRATLQSLQPDIEDESDEEPVEDGTPPSSYDDADEKENIPPPAAWSRTCTTVVPPPLLVASAAQLPHTPRQYRAGLLPVHGDRTNSCRHRHQHHSLCTLQRMACRMTDERCGDMVVHCGAHLHGYRPPSSRAHVLEGQLAAVICGRLVQSPTISRAATLLPHRSSDTGRHSPHRHRQGQALC